MLHQTWNLRYSRHIRIITFIDLEPFLLAISLNANFFSNLIHMFICKCRVGNSCPWVVFVSCQCMNRINIRQPKLDTNNKRVNIR